jgi:hypothetical protein
VPVRLRAFYLDDAALAGIVRRAKAVRKGAPSGEGAAWGARNPSWSCCALVFVDQTAEDIAAVDLLGGWRFRHALAL